MTEEEQLWDDEDPLARMKGESAKANIALRDYWRMGPGRSLRKLLARYDKQAASESQAEIPPTAKWSTLCGWSAKFDWQRRIAARAAIQAAADAAKWAARREALREDEWEQSRKLLEVAGKILAEAPMFVKNQRRLIPGEDGAPDREVITLALDGQLAVKAAEAGSKLGRLAAEMENERQKVVLALEKEVEAILETARQVLDDADYARLLARLSGAAGGEATTEAAEDDG